MLNIKTTLVFLCIIIFLLGRGQIRTARSCFTPGHLNFLSDMCSSVLVRGGCSVWGKRGKRKGKGKAKEYVNVHKCVGGDLK